MNPVKMQSSYLHLLQPENAISELPSFYPKMRSSEQPIDKPIDYLIKLNYLRKNEGKLIVTGVGQVYCPKNDGESDEDHRKRFFNVHCKHVNVILKRFQAQRKIEVEVNIDDICKEICNKLDMAYFNKDDSMTSVDEPAYATEPDAVIEESKVPVAKTTNNPNPSTEQPPDDAGFVISKLAEMGLEVASVEDDLLNGIVTSLWPEDQKRVKTCLEVLCGFRGGLVDLGGGKVVDLNNLPYDLKEAFRVLEKKNLNPLSADQISIIKVLELDLELNLGEAIRRYEDLMATLQPDNASDDMSRV